MGVFVLSDSQGLVALTPSEFVREDDFQQLLERYPDLLSGNQSGIASSQRWLLIKRKRESRQRRAARADGHSIICSLIRRASRRSSR